MRKIELAALLVLTACNARFGLDRVVLDSDNDGLEDEADNCPDVANVDQYDFDRDGTGDACGTCAAPSNRDTDADGVDDACDECVGEGEIGIDSGGDGIDDGCEPCKAATGDDIDADGIDDACDLCLNGPDHDEDGDALQDLCDACPSVPNPDNLLGGDLDRVYGACDPDTDARDPGAGPYDQVPRLFDAFGDDSNAWIDPNWMIADDAAHISAASVRKTKITVPVRFLVETKAKLASGASLSLRLPGTVTTSCTLTAAGTLTLVSWNAIKTTAVASGVDTSGPVTIWFRSRYDTQDGSFLIQSCVATDQNGNRKTARIPNVIAPQPFASQIHIDVEQGGVDLDYVWVLAN